jgi:hypothetical protein
MIEDIGANVLQDLGFSAKIAGKKKKIEIDMQ